MIIRNRRPPDWAHLDTAAVTQICNLLYRGFPIRRAWPGSTPGSIPAPGRMQFGDTADFKSALQTRASCRYWGGSRDAPGSHRALFVGSTDWPGYLPPASALTASILEFNRTRDWAVGSSLRSFSHVAFADEGLPSSLYRPASCSARMPLVLVSGSYSR